MSYDHQLIRCGEPQNAPKRLCFDGDPGGARTHDPLIKSQRVHEESTAYGRILTPIYADFAYAALGYDQGYDQGAFDLFRVKEGATFRLSWLRSARVALFGLIGRFRDSFTHRFTHQLGGGAP